MTGLYLILRKLILPLAEIDTNLPKAGTIIDFGCGQGIISKYLAQTKTRKIIGIDNDPSRLPKSNEKNLIFIKEDLTKLKLPKITGAVISDVLHHIKPEYQKLLIENAYQALEKGGILIIKEIDTREIIRSRLSRFWDFIFYPNDKIYFNSSINLKDFLKKTGFRQIDISRPCRLFPGSTTLLICQK